MTKLKQFSMSLAKYGLLFNLLILPAFIFSGCSYSTQPTYQKEKITPAIEDICKKEYAVDVKVNLVGSTLWLYLPFPEGILEKTDKPEKIIERFVVEQNNNALENGVFSLNYLVKPIPKQEKFQDVKFSKKVVEKINNVWKALRRVVFSMEKSEQESLKFFVILAADTKNGFKIKEIFYCPDFKKVSYGLIAWEEYQHRAIQETEMFPVAAAGATEPNLEYKDIAFEDFILGQIRHRIQLKFQEPEERKNTDIDKEIFKITKYTLGIYGFKDFSILEMENLLTGKKSVFNRAAVFSESKD